MSISKDVFKVNTANVIKAHNIISSRLRLMKDVLPSYGKYPTFCNDIIPYLERLEGTMSIANRIQRKMNRIRQDKDIMFYYFKVGDHMEAFHILEKIERKHTLHEVNLEQP